MSRFRAGALFHLVLLGLPGAAAAHREDYLDETPVFLTLERGEVEPEYWFDVGFDRSRGFAFTRHNVAVEAAVTDRWMCDLRATVRHERGAGPRFDAGRAETRVRFGEEGEHPVDAAASAEFNAEREPGGGLEPGLEPRVILSRDFGTVNVTVNLPVEIPLGGGRPSFDPTVGAREGTGGFRVGAELKYFGRDRKGAAIPQLWILLWEGGTFKAGYSRGFDRNREDFARVALETEL